MGCRSTVVGSSSRWFTACDMIEIRSRIVQAFVLFGGVVLLAGCRPVPASCGDGYGAEHAYLLMDEAVGTAIDLAFRGVNATTDGEVALQTEPAVGGGYVTVFGQLDARDASSVVASLSLRIEGFQELKDETAAAADPGLGCEATYYTYRNGGSYDPDFLPVLMLSAVDIPNGTYTASLVGTVYLSGAKTGPLEVDLALSGQIEPDPDVVDCPNTDCVRRVEGTTTVVGKATWNGDTYDVNMTL